MAFSVPLRVTVAQGDSARPAHRHATGHQCIAIMSGTSSLKAILLTAGRDALLMNAGAEVGLGFLTLLKLFTRDRNIMLAFMVW